MLFEAMDKLVSIIIPTYSRPDSLKNAIDSVLEQTYKNIEVIVVDDNGIGTKNNLFTKHLLKNYRNDNRVKYIEHKTNKNGSAARNTGIKNASGYYIGFLDDDDTFFPNKILEQVKEHESKRKIDKSYQGCYCNYQITSQKEGVIVYKNTSHGNLLQELLNGKNSISAGSTLLITRKVIDDIGMFDESFQRHQDWEYLVRYFRKYKLALAENILVNINLDNRLTNFSKQFAHKSYDNKKHFLEVFQKDIESLHNSSDIFVYQWMSLAELMIRCRAYNLFWESIKNAMHYRAKLSMVRYFFRIGFYFIDTFIPMKKHVIKLIK